MRRLVAVTSLLACLLFVSVAQAADVFSVNMTNSVAKHPSGITLGVTSDEAAQSLAVTLPPGMKVNAAKLPRCSASKLQNGVTCPKARAGTVTGDVAGTTSGITDTFSGIVYNTGKGIVLSGNTNTVPTRITLVGMWTGGTLTFANLSVYSFAGDAVGVRSMTLTINKTFKVKKKKISYFTNPRTCVGSWALGLNVMHASGVVISAASVPCRKK